MVARTSKKKAVATRKTGGAMSLAQIKKQLSEQASSIKDRIGSAGESNLIKTKGKVFTFPDGSVVQGPMDIVIVDFISMNRFWPGVYNADNPEPPECFALGDDPRNMIPSSNSADKQADSCNECPNNEYGSSLTGKGKACKNSRVLLVLPPDTTDPEEPLLRLEVTPTALKNFDGYANGIVGKFNVPPVGVVTTVDFHPELDYPSLVFSGGTPNENLQAHYARIGEARALLTTEPSYEVVEESKPKRKPRARATRARR